MNILEAMKQLRDDIKTWVSNNIRALAASKADVDHTHDELRRLPAPVISSWNEGDCDGNILRLDMSSGENISYRVYCGKDANGYDGVEYIDLGFWDMGVAGDYFTIEANLYDYFDTVPGTYSAYVIAEGDGENTFDSLRSNIVTFTVLDDSGSVSTGVKLATPIIVFATDRIRVTKPVENAVGYELWVTNGDGFMCEYCDDLTINSSSDIEYIFPSDDLGFIGEYEYYVIAKGDGVNYLDSDPSNVVTGNAIPATIYSDPFTQIAYVDIGYSIEEGDPADWGQWYEVCYTINEYDQGDIPFFEGARSVQLFLTAEQKRALDNLGVTVRVSREDEYSLLAEYRFKNYTSANQDALNNILPMRVAVAVKFNPNDYLDFNEQIRRAYE